MWEARQESLNRLVAVKVDQRSLDQESEQLRFLREAGAAGRMSGHPGIVTVHDAGILWDERPFLVMELCPGGSLTKWLSADPPPTQRAVRDVGVKIADALAAAHAIGVLHRDVKPANILIDAYGNPGLADFGLAALPEPWMDASRTIEALTPAYAPPEAFRQDPPTAFGDVYSLGATLYALLSGRSPRWSETTGTPSVPEILERQKQPIRRIPGVDRAFMDLLMQAMADDPADRPTAARLRDRLSALTLSTRVAARTPDDVETTSAPVMVPILGQAVQPNYRPPPRGRRIVLAAAVVLGALLAAAAAVVGFTSMGASGGPTAAASSAAASSAAASSAAASTASTPGAGPAGFADCSAALGDMTYCPTAAECWGGVFSYADQPPLATPAPCTANHVYQTFAAGPLGREVRSQSQLEADARVKEVCTRTVANSLLAKGDRRDNWEVFAVGPQKDDIGEDFYRCIFGRGERTKPFVLQIPA